MLSLFYVIQYNKPAHKSQSNILYFVNNIYTFLYFYVFRDSFRYFLQKQISDILFSSGLRLKFGSV